MNKEMLKEQIKRHEGEVLEVYADSLGFRTLGVGHLIKRDDHEYILYDFETGHRHNYL